jgi:hypothetical protein
MIEEEQKGSAEVVEASKGGWLYQRGTVNDSEERKINERAKIKDETASDWWWWSRTRWVETCLTLPCHKRVTGKPQTTTCAMPIAA